MTQGLGPTDLSALFSLVFGEIATVRASRTLPPLTSTHVGAEWLHSEEDAPRICIVPSKANYDTARGLGNQTGVVGDFNPKPLFRRLLSFDAYCWGDDLPRPQTEADTLYSFNSAIELERELIVALSHNLGGPAALRLHGAQWDQPTDMNRRGRLLILSFAFETPVTQEPYIVLPYSTTAGVQIHATMETVFPDGQSSIAGVIIVPQS